MTDTKAPPLTYGGFSRVRSRDEIHAAAAKVPTIPLPRVGEDRVVSGLTFTPGGIRVWRRNWDAMNRADERAKIGHLRDDLLMPAPNSTAGIRGEISAWSAKSRSNMIWVMGAVDWTPFVDLVADGRAPALVTLTLPGDWLTVAPTGDAFKKLINKFRARYRSAWGYSHMAGVWKLEFQRRGAPHFHLLTVPPIGAAGGRLGNGLPFAQWLSLVWADVVNHPDPEEKAKHVLAGTGVDYAEALRYADPRRISVYFSKHGTFADKEYQNIVPVEWREPGKGPGRFWGVWKLDVIKANVIISDNAQYAVLRHLRKLSDRDSYSASVRKVGAWTDMRTGEIHDPRARKRKVARRVRRMRRSAGFLMVNDGTELASGIARVVANWLAQSDFFEPAPNHLSTPARTVDFHDHRKRPPEAHEFGRANLDHGPGHYFGVHWIGEPLPPVGAGTHGELDIFGHGGSIASLLAELLEDDSRSGNSILSEHEPSHDHSNYCGCRPPSDQSRCEDDREHRADEPVPQGAVALG